MKTQTQVIIGATAVVLFAGGMGWMLTHPRGGRPVDPALSLPLPPPVVSGLKAIANGQVRDVADGATLSLDESVDFQVAVARQCFVYVYRVQGNTARLDWGHQAADTAWEAGLYAPNWYGTATGVHFDVAGPAALYVLVSPLPIVDAGTWSIASIEAPGGKCPRCAVAAVHFQVKP